MLNRARRHRLLSRVFSQDMTTYDLETHLAKPCCSCPDASLPHGNVVSALMLLSTSDRTPRLVLIFLGGRFIASLTTPASAAKFCDACHLSRPDKPEEQGYKVRISPGTLRGNMSKISKRYLESNGRKYLMHPSTAYCRVQLGLQSTLLASTSSSQPAWLAPRW